MSGLLEVAGMLLDDAVVRVHRWCRDWHDDALRSACERRRARIVRWTGRL